MMTTTFKRIRRDLTRLGLGVVQIVTQAKTQRVNTRRTALFDELVEDGQVAVLKALLAGEATWAELEEAKRHKEHMGSAVLAGVELNRPLFPAMRATLPRMGHAKSTRKRYGNSLNALERQTLVPWPRSGEKTPMRVKDLIDVDWETMSAGWGKSAADWNHVARFVSAFLTTYRAPAGHPKAKQLGRIDPFRVQVVARIPMLTEEERVPDLSPELFWRIMAIVPEHVRPAYMTLLITGMRDRSEYLACTKEHLLPHTHKIRPPGTKTKKAKERQPISVDPSLWVWIEAGIPSPVRYKMLRQHWMRACLSVGAAKLVETGKMVTRRKRLDPGWKQRGERKEMETVPELRYVGLHLHDLRHALAQVLSDEGRPLNDVQDVLRHASPAMSAKYARRTSTKKSAETIAGVLNRKGA